MRGIRPASATLVSEVDRRTQNLPIPFAGLAPAHRTERGRSAWGRRLRRQWMNWLATVLAVAGIALALGTPEVAAYEKAGVVHLGNVILQASARAAPNQTAFTGEVALVITALPGRLKAAAVTSMNGTPTSGWCILHATSRGDAAEHCAFQEGSRQLSSSDTFRASDGQWARLYSDGRRVTYRVPRGATAIPIPLPLGN